MCTYFKTETEDHSLTIKYGGTGLVSEKMEALYAELRQWKQPPVVILQQANFTIYLFCGCGWESSEDQRV